MLNGELKIGKRTKIKDLKIEHDCRMYFDGLNYYILIPVSEKINKPIYDDKKVIALDPGVRTFMTGYSNTDTVEYKSRNEVLKKLYDKIDVLKSIRNKRKVYNFKRKIRKLNRKIKFIVNDIHWKVITDLKKHYTDILLPSFDTQEMVIESFLRSTTKKKNDVPTTL
jgi:putative transposase